MPPMSWLGRRWRMASDELFFPLSFDLLLSIGSVVLIFGTLSFGDQQTATGTRSLLPRCPNASGSLQWCLLLLAVSNLAVIITVILTGVLSIRGSIFETSKRKKVGIGLYTVAVSVLATLILSVMSFCYVLGGRQLQGCTAEIITLEIALCFSVCLCGLFILFLVSAFDPIGRRRYEALDEYSHVWWKRLRWMCCGFSAEKEANSAYESAAVILAQSFRAYDIVTSDIVAGVLLLNGYQTTCLRQHANRVQLQPPPEGVRERRTVQAVALTPLSDADKQKILLLREYSRFYMATYGWMLQQYMHCCTGVCTVFCHDPCMCCRSHPGKHYGSKTYCDLSTVLLVTGVKEENVLVSQWTSDIYKPVHYVAYDEKMNAVVVAIRGTQSLSDCLTDISALPTPVELADTPPNSSADDFYVHGGMYESANYVLRSLQYYGVLDSVKEGKFKESKVIVLGHSLGAGVSIILSTLLWSQHPDIRERLQCLAYSPPGGLMSLAIVDYCAPFTVGCFAGQDMIPRVAQHTFDRFREDMFDLMAVSPHPKAYLFMKCFKTPELVKSFHPSSPNAQHCSVSSEAVAFRERLRTTSCAPEEEPKKLFPCKTLIHFRKMVERRQRGACAGTEEVFVPSMEGPEDVQVIIAAPTMFSDHFPNFLFGVLESVCERLEAGELERYFQCRREASTDEPLSSVSTMKEPVALAVRIPAATFSLFVSRVEVNVLRAFFLQSPHKGIPSPLLSCADNFAQLTGVILRPANEFMTLSFLSSFASLFFSFCCAAEFSHRSNSHSDRKE
eukprot:gene12515-8570_t